MIADFEALAKELSLPEFDLLLVGDGSGSTFNNPCGWACVAWNKVANQIQVHNGGMSCGTNNFAELIPYIQALWHFDQTYRDLHTPGKKAKVCVVTDSEVTVKCGNGIYTRKGNGCLWKAVEWFEQSGLYDISWYHVYRNTNRFSKRCDWIAGQTRVNIEVLRKDLLSP